VSQDLQHNFRGLGDPTRRTTLMHLHQQEFTIAELVYECDLSPTGFRKHLPIILQGDLITVTP